MRPSLHLLAIVLCVSCSVTRAQVTNGLIAAWTFNSGTANDDIGTNDGVVNGAVLTTDRFGNANKAYDLGNDHNYIEVPYTPLFTPGTSSFSVSLWFRTSSSSTDTVQEMFTWYRCGADPSCGTEDAADYTMYMKGDTATWDVRDDMGTDVYLTSTGTPNDGLWHHLVDICDRTNNLVEFYVDNVTAPAVSVTFTALDDGGFAIPLSFGRLFRTGWAEPGYYFKGVVDDIFAYNRALSAAEVDALFTTPYVNVGISSIEQDQRVKLYPDPATEELTIELPSAGAFDRVAVLNAQGQPLTEQRINGPLKRIPIAALPAGVYFAVLGGDVGERRTLRFTKQ